MNKEKRSDSYGNLISGLGKRTDKTQHTDALRDEILVDEALTTIYMADGLGARIIDVIPDDGTRNGFTVKNDDKGKIQEALAQLNFTGNLCKAWKFSRLYRGAIIAIITEKGELDKPIPVNYGKVTQLRVYSAARIEILPTDINGDPKNKYFDDVEIFKVRKRDGGYLKIHRDRCLLFEGELVPDYDTSEIDTSQKYWGLSTLQRIYNRLKYYGSVEQGCSNLMEEAVIGKYTLENLSSILAMNNKDALDKILMRLEVMNASKSIINAVLLGKNESYERDSVNFSGVDSMIDRMMMNLSGVSGIPVTKLFGRSPAGMNSTGQSDERNYYDGIRAYLINKVKPEANKLISLVGKTEYGKPGDYGIDDFNSLWELTEKEYAEIQKMRADTYQIYMQNGVLSPDEVREKEFPNGDGVTV